LQVSLYIDYSAWQHRSLLALSCSVRVDAILFAGLVYYNLLERPTASTMG